MKTIPIIEELEKYKFPGYPWCPNQQVLYKFKNGFGASVILGKYSYGLEMMLYTPDWDFDKEYVKSQLMALESNLYYDVVGYMDKERMTKLLHGIKKLKPFIEESGESE